MPEAVPHSPADEALMAKLADIRENARHAADPRQPAADLAAALLEWFEAEG
jgi:hypothetical protein